MLPDQLTTFQVADLFGVSVATIRSWRTTTFSRSPLRLLPDYPGGPGDPARYDWATLEDFVSRNPAYSLPVRCVVSPVRPSLNGVQL